MRSRPFIALYISVFVAVMGIAMVSPLLPVYAEELGASGVWLGLTFSSFAIVQAIFGPFAGRLSDRFGRKPFILTGLVIYFIAALGYLTAHSFIQVIAFRAFSGLGTSLIFSVARAYIGDMTPPGQEGRWFGFFATADIVGFGTGPLVAGVFRELLGFRSVFVAMAFLLAASAVIIFTWLPMRPPARRAGNEERKDELEPRVQASFGFAIKDRLVLALTFFMLLISLSSGASMSFLALRLEDQLHATPILIGIAFATQDLTGGFSQPFLGRLADRRDRRLLVTGGLLGGAAFLTLLGLAGHYWMVVALLMGTGFSSGVGQVSASAMQVVAGRRVGMGTVLGLGSAGNGIGIVVGSVAGGVLLDFFGLSAPFIFGGIVMAAGAFGFVALTSGIATRDTEVLQRRPRERPLPDLSGAGQ